MRCDISRKKKPVKQNQRRGIESPPRIFNVLSPVYLEGFRRLFSSCCPHLQSVACCVLNLLMTWNDQVGNPHHSRPKSSNGTVLDMLNRSAKVKALENLNDEEDKLSEVAKEMKESAVSLFELRQESSATVVQECESYLSSLASAPKELDRSVSEFRTEFEDFQQEIRELESQAEGVEKVSGSTAGAGAAAGAGVAAMGPSAAMAFATTFGTASTGTAISSLSGAAATNAALAWIGGGAVSAGGGGMAMGSTILSLSGPVGWTIGGVALAGSAVYARRKNKKIAENANQKAKEVRKKRGRLETALEETRGLIELTEKHARGVERQLRYLRESAPDDYTEFSNEEKERLGALINNVQALSELLNRNVEVDSDE